MDSSNLYKPTDTFCGIMMNNFLWALLGIILGLIVNKTTIFIQNVFEIKLLLIQILLHLILCSFVLALININFNYLGWSWQNITPGLFFVSFFFGVQYSIFTNIQNL